MMSDEGRQGLGVPIYVLANQGNNFAETLDNDVGFRFDEHISFRLLSYFIALHRDIIQLKTMLKKTQRGLKASNMCPVYVDKQH